MIQRLRVRHKLCVRHKLQTANRFGPKPTVGVTNRLDSRVADNLPVDLDK